VSPTQILPIAIAALSLVVAAATFFLTQLGPPKISAHIGRLVELAYDKNRNADLVVHATFINASNRTGIVREVAVTLRRIDDPQPQCFMLWDDFMRYDEKKDEYEITEIAHALALPGKEAVHQIIWFSWFGTLPTNLEYRAGKYELTFWWWEGSGRPPKKQSRLLEVTAAEFRELERHRAARDEVLTEISLDRTYEANMTLSDEEVRELLGD